MQGGIEGSLYFSASTYKTKICLQSYSASGENIAVIFLILFWSTLVNKLHIGAAF
jgi:hypothetical protein